MMKDYEFMCSVVCVTCYYSSDIFCRVRLDHILSHPFLCSIIQSPLFSNTH